MKNSRFIKPTPSSTTITKTATLHAEVAAPRNSLKQFAWLSIIVAIITIGMKAYAYYLTDSVGILSDAVESLVNLAGALLALTMLTIALRPADSDHPHGHSKAEYFSSGVEGVLIIIAAIGIMAAATDRFIHPRMLQQVSTGLLVTAGASVLNLLAGMVILQGGKKYNSITLIANGKHLLTDVWTSAAIIVGIILVVLTGWSVLDPIVAILVAINIWWVGSKIVIESVSGLMDSVLPEEDLKKIREVLNHYRSDEIDFHALLTRKSAASKFISFHIMVPGVWSVFKGHDLTHEIEADILKVLPGTQIITHLESIEDPASWDDVEFSAKI